MTVACSFTLSHSLSIKPEATNRSTSWSAIICNLGMQKTEEQSHINQGETLESSAFHFSAREGSMCEMKSAHTRRKGASLWWKANRAIKDSVLMQKVLAALQSFLSDHFCYTYSRKKGRFSIAESLFSVTDVIWTWKVHLPTARKHNVPTLTTAKICRPPGGV